VILTQQQAAAVLAVMNTGGTGSITFKRGNSHELVVFRDSDTVFIAQFTDGGRDAQETYASFSRFALAYGESPRLDLARAAAHYEQVAAEAKTMAQHVADGEGRN
jgi:hypothetical protein